MSKQSNSVSGAIAYLTLLAFVRGLNTGVTTVYNGGVFNPYAIRSVERHLRMLKALRPSISDSLVPRGDGDVVNKIHSLLTSLDWLVTEANSELALVPEGGSPDWLNPDFPEADPLVMATRVISAVLGTIDEQVSVILEDMGIYSKNDDNGVFPLAEHLTDLLS